MNISGPCKGWFQIDLATLFTLVAAIACFFAGRLSLLPTLNDLRRENHALRTDAEKHVKLARDAVADIAEQSNARVVDFQSLYDQVEALRHNDMDYFVTNWPSVHDDLSRYVDSGALAALPNKQQERLGWLLEYLRACSHPYIFQHHRHEIATIQFALDVPELNESLREILDGNDSSSDVAGSQGRPTANRSQ